MKMKVLEEKDINQDYVIYFYKMESGLPRLRKEIFENEQELKNFIMSKRYIGIDNIYIDGKIVYFRMNTVVELIYS